MRQKVTQKARFNFWDTWLWVVWVLILGGIVCAGLDPRGFRFGNEVAVGEGGLSLGRFGRVQAEIAGGVEGGFTVVVEGRAAGAGLRSFRTIAGFYELGGGGRLLIGQWRDNLVVGVGESPEDWWVDIPFFPSAGTRFELVVVSSREGTRIDRNGERVFEDPGVRLPMPRGPLRVTLGNSLEARHGWVGQLGMVAVLGEALGGGRLAGCWMVLPRVVCLWEGFHRFFSIFAGVAGGGWRSWRCRGICGRWNSGRWPGRICPTD
jgi:hypothetical protein